MVVFIVLAVLFFLMMAWGIFLNRKRFKSVKLNGTYVYTEAEDIQRKNGTRKKQWGFGIQKLKGVGTVFQIRYKIPEFYQKIKNRDSQAIAAALIVFGATGFVCCTFLAVGVGLIESGENRGWIIIAVVILFVLLVIVSHRKALREAENSGDKTPD
jgi:hypothetical protein